MRTMKIVGVCLWLVLSMACKKEDEVSNCLKLEGVWQCESWKEDGEEFFGDTIFITDVELTFKKLDGVQGDYTMDITYLIGGTEMIIGAYVVNESCDEVTITPKAGTPTTYDFTISGDKLTLAGNINAVEIELQF
ncbi:MAG TPA: lipocalin family protein, partial [Saprospiraceae bacterium]|nr:lipocalin family protein [Saprospiraceae bacterium]